MTERPSDDNCPAPATELEKKVERAKTNLELSGWSLESTHKGYMVFTHEMPARPIGFRSSAEQKKETDK